MSIFRYIEQKIIQISRAVINHVKLLLAFYALYFQKTDVIVICDCGIWPWRFRRVGKRRRGWYEIERKRESEREGERAARERNHRSDVENTRASRVPTWKRHRQLGSRRPFWGCVLG